jgi:hypothetical protein
MGSDDIRSHNNNFATPKNRQSSPRALRPDLDSRANGQQQPWHGGSLFLQSVGANLADGDVPAY